MPDIKHYNIIQCIENIQADCKKSSFRLGKLSVQF